MRQKREAVRKDFQVKVRGYRIEAMEVETALLNLGAFTEAVVLAHGPGSPSLTPGPEERRLVAYLMPARLPAPTVGELRRSLAETLPEYMIPSIFVMLEQFPRLPSGKVDRKALSTHFLLARPWRARPELRCPFVAPRNPIEEALARIWAEQTPDAVAILAPGRRPLTYRGLSRQVEEAVEALNARGVGRNDRVAMVLPEGPEMAVASLAIAAGATCAPLNPAYCSGELDFHLGDLNAKALLVLSGSESPAVAVARSRGIPVLELVPQTAAEAGSFTLAGEVQPGPIRHRFAHPDDAALVLYTSGTTARPKLVPLTHRNICASAHDIRAAVQLAQGLTARPLTVDSRTAKFDLTLYLSETEQGLAGTWQYNVDLFEAATIERIASHFQTLLEEIVANPERRLSEFPLLADAERRQVVVEWNRTEAPCLLDRCFHHMFEEQAERTPDAVAVECGEERLLSVLRPGLGILRRASDRGQSEMETSCRWRCRENRPHRSPHCEYAGVPAGRLPAAGARRRLW